LRFPTYLLLILAACLAACSSRTDEVLPLSRTVVGASRIEAVEIVLQPAARRAVAFLDERAAKAGAQGAAAQPFGTLLETSVRDAAVRAGLTNGRSLRLVLDIDRIDVQGTGAALFGREDRLAGTVFVRDAASGEPLGQLYVDTVGTNGGLLALALRGGGVRERLLGAFSERVAGALSGRKPARSY
jgi:hypothetical protein